MMQLGHLAFAAPWMLLGLLALPVLWWLLRLMPPSPRQIVFPAIRFLLGLRGDEKTPQAAPWWLVMLRLSIVAAVVFAAARPVWNPETELAGDGALLLVIDDGWASAPTWRDRVARADALLQTADRSNRPVYLVLSASVTPETAQESYALLSATEAQSRLAAHEPKPWAVDRQPLIAAIEQLAETQAPMDVYWLSNGLQESRTEPFLEALSAVGPTTVILPDASRLAMLLSAPAADDASISFTVSRALPYGTFPVAIIGYADDGRPLARQDGEIADGDTLTRLTLDAPLDIRNQISRVALEGVSGVGGNVLLDDRWQQRKIGIVTDVGSQEALPLLSETYFLSRALMPLGTIGRGPLDELLEVAQSVLLLPDETVLESGDTERLLSWIEEGGMVIRFAGPRLAGNIEDPLTPVQLRRGGRQLSGAMLWTEPARIGDAAKTGPFVGMPIPSDVEIARQVLAEPSLDLDEKTWLRLEDGSPLVTADRLGEGWLVLVHTTANTQWSDLSLSGLFVDMLTRLTTLGRSVRDAARDDGLAAPYRTFNGFGQLGAPPPSARPILLTDEAGALVTPSVTQSAPPGFYGNEDVRFALNLADSISELEVLEALPSDVRALGYEAVEEARIGPFLLALALLLLLIDTILTMVLRGYSLLGSRKTASASTVPAFLMALLIGAASTGFSGSKVLAQDFSERALQAAQTTTFAYVLTGNPQVDRLSAQGLNGLSLILRQRTAVEAGDPVGIDIEQDELAVYPLLYWPVLDSTPALSSEAADRLNRYMAGGGMILFDTRDGHLAGSRLQTASPALQRLIGQLTIPPVAPVPLDHVLTRSFYLMNDFPGRWSGGTVWVEAGESISNDGVSPVIVGDADWAGAWAIDERGQPVISVVGADERQREMAFRFGINLAMYTLTGNYKADQVHIPDILERLGQ